MQVINLQLKRTYYSIDSKLRISNTIMIKIITDLILNIHRACVYRNELIVFSGF